MAKLRWCWRHAAYVFGRSICKLCAARGVLTHLSDGPGQAPAGAIVEVTK